MEKKDIQEGMQYFAEIQGNSVIVKVVDAKSPYTNIVSVGVVVQSSVTNQLGIQDDSVRLVGTTWFIDVTKLHPIAWSLFKIGQTVFTIWDNPMVVTGFEYQENRVITKSARAKKDRHRYSYTIEELQHVDSEVKIRVGYKYKINKKDIVMAMRHPDMSPDCAFDMIYLAHITGTRPGNAATEYLIRSNKKVSWEQLRKNNIFSIEAI
jgi:hypothetical protein